MYYIKLKWDENLYEMNWPNKPEGMIEFERLDEALENYHRIINTQDKLIESHKCISPYVYIALYENNKLLKRTKYKYRYQLNLIHTNWRKEEYNGHDNNQECEK